MPKTLHAWTFINKAACNTIDKFTPFSFPNACKEFREDIHKYVGQGNEIEVLTSGQRIAGYYSTNWNGINVPSGVYMVRLEAGGKVDVRKIVLMR